MNIFDLALNSDPACENFAFRSYPTNLKPLVTGWVSIQLLDVIRTRANSILMEEKNSDSRWSETAREFLSKKLIPQANPTQPVTDHRIACVVHFVMSTSEDGTLAVIGTVWWR